MAQLSERDKGAHLLRRFGLGSGEAELDYYMRDGLAGAIDRLLDFRSIDEGFDVDVLELRGPNNAFPTQPGLVIWWALRLVTTRRPLQEKMTLFWHDHFATSMSKVQQPYMMWQQNEILRRYCTGNFRTLLKETSKDPAMLQWLDAQENVAGKPNENFAREVMELFTLGIGNYTEEDVQEAARAFTGWNARRFPAPEAIERKSQAEFQFRPRMHDSGPKTILGQTARFTGDQVLDMLCDHPRTAEHITLKIWEWFVYPGPEKAVVDRFAKVFRDSELEIAALLRAIMTSAEFYSERAQRAVVKNPVDFCIPTMRQLRIGENALANLRTRNREERLFNAEFRIGQQAAQSMRNMGMWLFYPPDVDGWEGGPAWITSATMVERFKWADRVFPQRLPFFNMLSGRNTPEAVAAKVVSLFDAPVPSDKMPQLVEAARKATGGTVTARNANAAATDVARLIFASPEFQFA
jgi:uncharacterized protein (DUF1800 family)